MKNLLKLLFVMMVVVTFVNCNGKTVEPTVPPAEHIVGYVTNEEGNALEGIRVEIFFDEQKTEPFVLNYYTFNEKGELVLTDDEEYFLLTREDGSYMQGQASQWKKGDPYEKTIYVFASDPAEVYAPQMKEGQLVYDRLSYVGEGRVDFALSKK